MAITYKNNTYDVVDNGDGTFTLEPTDPVVAAADLIAEYRTLRAEAKSLNSLKSDLAANITKVTADLSAIRARRDDLKLMLETAGQTPDDDITP